MIVLGATAHDRQLAAQYRATLAAAHGSYFEAARLRAPGEISAGVAYGYRGKPSWIFVYVDPRYRSTPYTAELVMPSGRRVPLPYFRIDRATGSAGQAIPVDLHNVASIRVIGRTQGGVLEVTLPHPAGDDRDPGAGETGLCPGTGGQSQRVVKTRPASDDRPPLRFARVVR